MIAAVGHLPKQVVLRAVAGALVVLAAAPSARAQGRPVSGPTGRESRLDLSVGASWMGPIGQGTSTANLIAPDGSMLTLFSTRNRLAPAFGVDVLLGRALTATFSVEAAGAWTRGELESRVSSDFEGADLTIVRTALSRFTIEGAGAWVFQRRERFDAFVRGSAGWMRELGGERVLVDDGLVGTVGAGVKYWLRVRPSGRVKRTGVRVEGRVVVRSGGLSFGDRSAGIAPAVAGSFILAL